MTRLIMGIQLFIVLVFYKDVNALPFPVDRCMEILKFQEEISYKQLAGPEQVNIYCSNMTVFFTCIKNVVRETTGMSVKKLANHWLVKGTEHGKFLNDILETEDLVDEICTPGTLLHEEFLVKNDCFNNSAEWAMQDKKCEDQAVNVYEIFKDLREQRTTSKNSNVGEQIDECVIRAYELGCMGVTLYEACGEQIFNRYKRLVKRIGVFPSDVCSPDLMKTLKTTVLGSLNMTDSRKSLYRTIFNL